MKTNTLMIIATTALVLLTANVSAREPIFAEVIAIHKVLQVEGCDYVYLSMGERQLFVNDDGFEAEVKCEDNSTYVFNFDKDYALLGKRMKTN